MNTRAGLAIVTFLAGLSSCASPKMLVTGSIDWNSVDYGRPVSLGSWGSGDIPISDGFSLSVDLAGGCPRYRVVVSYWLTGWTRAEAFEVRLRTKWGDCFPLNAELKGHWTQPLIEGIHGTYTFECFEKPTEVLVAVRGVEKAFVVPQ